VVVVVEGGCCRGMGMLEVRSLSKAFTQGGYRNALSELSLAVNFQSRPSASYIDYSPVECILLIHSNGV
jgi:hypothetical protein